MGGRQPPDQYMGDWLPTIVHGGVVSLSSHFHGSSLGIEIDLRFEISGQTNGLLFRTTFSVLFFGPSFRSPFSDLFSGLLFRSPFSDLRFGHPFRSPFRVHTHGQPPRSRHGAGETNPVIFKRWVCITPAINRLVFYESRDAGATSTSVLGRPRLPSVGLQKPRKGKMVRSGRVLDRGQELGGS